MPLSYYRASFPGRPRHPRLEESHRAQVCVIGGGFAGVNTAHGLTERGMRDVVLIEAGELGHGASGRNGGFVFAGFSLDEAALLRQLGGERARRLHAGTGEAVETIRHRIRHHQIDCDAVEAGVIWANWFRDSTVVRERQRLLAEHYGVEWAWLSRDALRERIHSERYHAGLFEPDAFHFHPLKYLAGLAAVAAGAGVRLHEDSPATSLSRAGQGWRVSTPAGEIIADQVVLACGGYLAGLHRKVDSAVMPIATYVMTTEPLGERMAEVMATRAAVYDTRFAFDYYRPLPDSRLLWGGRISMRDRAPAEVERLLYRDMVRVFPQLAGVRIEHAWSGLMSYARHQMPQIGRIERGLWVAQAFGGHGVAPTTYAGDLLASAIAGGDERWRELDDYGLTSTHKPAGLLAAQLSYWWAGARDTWRERTEPKRG